MFAVKWRGKPYQWLNVALFRRHLERRIFLRGTVILRWPFQRILDYSQMNRHDSVPWSMILDSKSYICLVIIYQNYKWSYRVKGSWIEQNPKLRTKTAGSENTLSIVKSLERSALHRKWDIQLDIRPRHFYMSKVILNKPDHTSK